MLAEARDQARTIVAGAQATSDQLKAEAAGRAQAEYDRIVALAHSEVASARQRAIDEASGRIGEIVFDLVDKIVAREVDQSTHDDLVREAVAALNAEAAKGATPLIMLPKLEGFASALLGRLDATPLARVSADLESIDATILSRPDLSAVFTDTSISHVARGQVVTIC